MGNEVDGKLPEKKKITQRHSDSRDERRDETLYCSATFLFTAQKKRQPFEDQDKHDCRTQNMLGTCGGLAKTQGKGAGLRGLRPRYMAVGVDGGVGGLGVCFDLGLEVGIDAIDYFV